MELQADDAAARGLRRYVRLVGEALGLSGDGFCVELEAPVSSYLALDQRAPRFPTRDTALLWDERHGWSLAVESHDTEDLLVQAYLGIDVLPAPRVVARFATRLLHGAQTGQPDPPDLRALEVEDDLQQRLAAYAPSGNPLSAGHAEATVTPMGVARAEHEPVSGATDLFAVRVEGHGPCVVLQVSGELDMVTAPQLQESVNHALARHPQLLILDLTGVRFLGSAGMAVLINAHDAAQHHDQTGVRVVAAGHAVLRPLEVVGLATTLMIYPTLHAALAGSMTGARQPTSDRSRPTA